MMRIRLIALLLIPISLVCAAETPALPEPAGKIAGSLVIHGGGNLSSETLEAFMKLAGGNDARIVVIPTASDTYDDAQSEKELQGFKSRGAATVTLLHTRSREKADEAAFVEPLKQATGVWFGGGQQKNLEKAYVGTATERELHALLKRGGVIGGTSAGAAAMSSVMIRGGNPKAEVGQGFGFLPGAVIDQHFLKRERSSRLMAVLADHPGLVGLGIDEGTALVVHERQMVVLGDSSVSVCLCKSDLRPERVDAIKGPAMLDLVALSRAAIARAETPFPPPKMPAPETDGSGTLIIDGGSCRKEAIERFVAAAGGPDALIAVIPTAQGEELPGFPGEARLLQRAGAKNIKIVHARDRAEAADPKLLDVLREAKGIWFTGGRQWRLVDSFLGTEAEKLMHAVLKRGGAIGGSSAGATIQGEYLVRGNPLGNLQMMAEGYERGFGFLKSVAIDQHFAQRNRFADMSGLKKVFPQVVGLGIDEPAALVVSGHVLEVIGAGNVQIYDRDATAPSSEKDYEQIKPGEKYDLKDRKKISEK
jgi:cyanophycinase